MCQEETVDTTDVFRPAILKLRQTLGETQEGMARRLGCTLGSFQRWELGSRIPSGEYLVKMIKLCPNNECRAAFGIYAPAEGVDALRDIAHRQHRILQESLAVLEQLSKAGSPVAKAKLKMTARVLSQVVTAILAMEKKKESDPDSGLSK